MSIGCIRFGGGGDDEDAAIAQKHAELRAKTLEELDKKIEENFSKVKDAETLAAKREREFLQSLGVYDPD